MRSSATAAANPIRILSLPPPSLRPGGSRSKSVASPSIQSVPGGAVNRDSRLPRILLPGVLSTGGIIWVQVSDQGFRNRGLLRTGGGRTPRTNAERGTLSQAAESERSISRSEVAPSLARPRSLASPVCQREPLHVLE